MSQNAFPLDTIRHSTAHLMAQAIERVFSGKKVQFGVGPTIDTGFYYDVEVDHKITEEDLTKIEEMMKKIIDEKLPIERNVMSRSEAIKFWESKGQELKVELVSAIPEKEEISCYGQGDFIDLCRGPHVTNTKELPKSFKLLHVAGAYWRGDSNRNMLQRIYAASFLDKKQLDEHLHFLEEAKKRDHRKLGKELELFIFDQVAPGAPFFMPKGAFVYNSLVDYMRRLYRVFSYSEVITPQILDAELWHTSGHYSHYKENMFFSKIDEREFAVKPMNCPCHMLMFKHHRYSYRDLPLRFADFGRLHRYEKAGSLAGLTRVRTFCQDDAHIFLGLDQIQAEISKTLEMFFISYKHFGFKNIKVNLSTRPEDKAGDDATWDLAEGALRMALEKSGHQFFIKEGDGAFYGPKIDVEISDALNRYHQLGTIQLDFVLPERFDLRYVNQQGEMTRPVVIHRALLGSIERFIGVYLEHTAGALPFWMSPEQIVIVPIKNDLHLDYAQKLAHELTMMGMRVRVDDRNESMGLKTRECQTGKIPFMLAIGDKEIETNNISIRKYGDKFSKTLPLDEIKELFKQLDGEKVPEELKNR